MSMELKIKFIYQKINYLDTKFSKIKQKNQITHYLSSIKLYIALDNLLYYLTITNKEMMIMGQDLGGATGEGKRSNCFCFYYMASRSIRVNTITGNTFQL